MLYPISKLHSSEYIKLMEAKTEFKSKNNQNVQPKSYAGYKNLPT